MANLRVYRLTSTSAVTALGQGSTTVVNSGRIKQITAFCSHGGATGAGNITSELALNNSANGNSQISSLQSTDNLLARIGMASGVAGSSATPTLKLDMNRPVRPGDVMCINVLATGTFTSAIHAYDVYVEES